MANEKMEYVLDLDLLLGEIDDKKLVQRFSEVSNEITKAAAKASTNPTLEIGVKLDGKEFKASVDKVVDIVDKNLERLKPKSKDGQDTTQAYQEFFKRLKTALSAAASDFGTGTAAIYEELANRNEKALRGLSDKELAAVARYASATNLKNKLLKQALDSSASIFNSVGKDRIPVKPVLIDALDTELKASKRKFDEFNKFIKDSNVDARIRAEQNKRFRRQLITESPNRLVASADGSFNFRGLERALRNDVGELRRLQEDAPLERKSRVAAYIQARERRISRVQDRRREVLGSTLGTSEEQARVRATAAESRYQAALRKAKDSSASLADRKAAEAVAQRELNEATSQAYSLLKKVAPLQNSEDKAERDRFALAKQRVDNLALESGVLKDVVDQRKKYLDQEAARNSLGIQSKNAEDRLGELDAMDRRSEEFRKTELRLQKALRKAKAAANKLDDEDSYNTYAVQQAAYDMFTSEGKKTAATQKSKERRDKRVADEKARLEQELEKAYGQISTDPKVLYKVGQQTEFGVADEISRLELLANRYGSNAGKALNLGLEETAKRFKTLGKEAAASAKELKALDDQPNDFLERFQAGNELSAKLLVEKQANLLKRFQQGNELSAKLLAEKEKALLKRLQKGNELDARLYADQQAALLKPVVSESERLSRQRKLEGENAARAMIGLPRAASAKDVRASRYSAGVAFGPLLQNQAFSEVFGRKSEVEGKVTALKGRLNSLKPGIEFQRFKLDLREVLADVKKLSTDSQEVNFSTGVSTAKDLMAELEQIKKEASDVVKQVEKAPKAAAAAAASSKAAAATKFKAAVGRDIFERVGLRGVATLPKEEMRSVQDYLQYTTQGLGRIRDRIPNLPISEDSKKSRISKIDAQLYDLGKAQSTVQAEIKGNIGLLREAGRAVNSFFKYALIYGGLYRVSGEMANLIGNTVKFQDALKGIQAVSQATDAQMVRLAGSIRDVASNSSYSMAEIADAAQTLAQAGTDISKIPGALQAVNNFALATGGSLQTSADVLASAQNIYPNQNFNQLSDQLTGTVNVSKLSTEDLKTIFNLAAQTAASSGISSQQLLGASATLSNLGIKSSTIATGLRELILEIFSPDKQAIEFLKKRYNALGENLGEAQIKAIFRGFQNSDNPLQNAFAELRRLGVTGAARNDFRRIYETRAENVALPLISRPEALSMNIASVGQIGAAADGARVRLDSLAASLKTLGNELEMTTEAITGGALDTLKSTSDEASDLLKSFRDRIDERQIQGQSISSKVLPTIAAGAAAATSNSFGPVGKVVAGLTGALAGFATTTAAEGFGSTASAVTNWIITVFGLIKLLGGNRIKSWNDKLSFGGAKNPAKSFEVISTITGLVVSIFGTLGDIGRNLKNPLGLLKLAAAGLSKIGWVGGIITVASGLWELWQVMSDLDPKEQIDALRRKVANLEGEAQKTQEAFANFDPKADNSMAQQVQKTKDAVLKYQDTLKGIFGANATEAEKLLAALGDVGLEAGTPRANEIKDKLSKLTDGGISEKQMAKLVEAQNLFSQAQGDLIGKAGVILQRAVQLYQKPKDQLTEEEKSFLAAFEKAKATSAFSGIAEGANKLVEKADSLLQFIANVFDSQSGEVERARDKAKAELTRAEVGSSIDTGNSKAVEAQILQLLNAPTADNKKKLEELRKGLLERQQAGETRTGNVVTSRTAGAGEAVRLGDLIDQRMPDYQKALDEQAKTAEESAKQAKDQAAKDEADKERFAQEEEALRNRREELLRGRVENEKRAIQKEEEIIKAREAQEFESIAKEGGLLDQKYAYKQRQLKFEEDQANLEFRKLAAEANIQPTDTKTIFGAGNEKIAQAYERWQDAQLKSFELGKQLAQEKLSARNSIRPEAYSPNAAAEANAKEIKRLTDELNDTEKENIAEVEQKYNSIRDLTLANLDMEIAFLKTQESKYKPGDRDKYLRDLANLEQERRDADTSIEKKKNDRLRVLRDRIARQEIAALEVEADRLKKQIELLGNTPSTTRAQTLQVMRLPQGMTPVTPASMSGGSASGLSQNAQAAYQYFIGKGLKPYQAAGIVGNLMHESYDKVDPRASNASGAVGIAQWLYPSRKQGLLSKATPYDFQTQLDYIWEEYNSTMRGAKKKMLGTQDVVGATDSFLWDFENPGKDEANRDKRLANARKVLAAMQGQGAAYGYRALPASTSTGMLSWEDMSKAIDSDGLYKGDVFGTDAFKKNAPEVYQAIIGGAMKWQQEQGGKAKVIIRDLGRNGGKANHKNGFAGDVQLMDKNGKLLDNIMAGGETFRAYEKFWQDGMAYAMKYYPGMENYFRAGMYFGDGTPLDLMHGDVTQKYLGKVKAPDSNGGNLRTGANAYLKGKFRNKNIISQGIPNGDWNAYRQARFGEGLGSVGAYGIDMPVIGGDPGNQVQIAELSQRLKEVSDRIVSIAMENAKQSPTSKEDMARILQEYETRSFDRIKTEQDAIVDGIQSQLESQNRLLAQTEAQGLLQGPSYTATREAAGMANAPADELGRLQRLESVYLENAKVYYAAATDLTEKIKAVSEQEASLLRLQAELKAKADSGVELTPEEQAVLARTRGELDALSKGKKEFQAKLREIGQNSAEEQRALATNRQNQMNYNYSLFGETYQVPKYNPDGSPATRPVLDSSGKPVLDENGKQVVEQLYEVTEALGQLDQVDLKSIAGELNDLNYSFKNLGKNIRGFIVGAVDTFVSTIADKLVKGASKVDTAALNQARADLYQAQADKSQALAMQGAEIDKYMSIMENSDSYDPAAVQARKEQMRAAQVDALNAASAKEKAAKEQINAQEGSGSIGSALQEAFTALSQDFAAQMLKGVLLYPFEKLLNGFIGKADGTRSNPFAVVNPDGTPIGGTGKSGVPGATGDAKEGGMFDSILNPIKDIFFGIGDMFGSLFSMVTGLFSGGGGGGGWLGTAASIVGGLFFAKGGQVKGPGTGTSDSIPAWLSNGEYVLTAAEVQKIGVQNIEKWKSAMASPAKFAAGGLVQTFDSVARNPANYRNGNATGSGGSGAEINIIDQRSQANSAPIAATKSQGPDGKEMINIMVRDAVKSAINSGMLDRTMQANYGARRVGGNR